MSSFACKPPASRMTASNTVTIADPPIDKQLLSKPAGAWTFRSEAQDYSLDLPSSHWIQTKLVERTEFENRNKLDEHTHVVVSSVTKRTEEEYRDFLLKFRANTKGKTYISAPIFEEGMTDVGNPFFYMALIERGMLKLNMSSLGLQVFGWLRKAFRYPSFTSVKGVAKTPALPMSPLTKKRREQSVFPPDNCTPLYRPSSEAKP